MTLYFYKSGKIKHFHVFFSSHKKPNHVSGGKRLKRKRIWIYFCLSFILTWTFRKILLLDLQGMRALFKLNCSQVFHSPEHITQEVNICKNTQICLYICLYVSNITLHPVHCSPREKPNKTKWRLGRTLKFIVTEQIIHLSEYILNLK